MRIKTITIDGYNKPDSAYHGNMFLTGNGAMGVHGNVCCARVRQQPLRVGERTAKETPHCFILHSAMRLFF